jgi:hypothetical protein
MSFDKFEVGWEVVDINLSCNIILVYFMLFQLNSVEISSPMEVVHELLNIYVPRCDEIHIVELLSSVFWTAI